MPAKTPAASLPLWIGISVLINCVLVIAAGTGLAARAIDDTGQTPILVQAAISNGAVRADEPEASPPARSDEATRLQTPRSSSREESPGHAVPPENTHIPTTTEKPSTSEARPDTPRTRATSEESDPSPSQKAPVGQSRELSNDYDVPASSGPVAVESNRFGRRLGAGVPGAGKPGSGRGPDRTAGGGAEVLTAQEKGGSFAVGGIPSATGSGPGLGGSGSGIGVGGSGDGVGMPGSGDGPGMGGQGGDAALPKKVAKSDASNTPGVPASSAGASGGARSDQGGAAPAGGNTEEAHSAGHANSEGESSRQKSRRETQPKPSKADLSRFQRMVQRKIAAARTYPSSARRAGQSGNARVTFSITTSGHPRGVRVTGSSGHAVLDTAAVRAVHNAAPFVPFPKGLDKSVRVNATVRFTLN